MQAACLKGRGGRKKRVETHDAKPESEWKEQVVQIRRVTKVVKGGKKLSFRAIVIVGNKKGQVGVGCAKASEAAAALKALRPFNEVAKKRGLTMAELLN